MALGDGIERKQDEFKKKAAARQLQLLHQHDVAVELMSRIGDQGAVKQRLVELNDELVLANAAVNRYAD